MNNLKNAVDHAAKIENMLIEAAGEVTEEIQKELMIGGLSLGELVDARYLTIDRLELSVQFFEQKKEQYENICLSLKSAQKYVLDSIKQHMIETGKKELIGNDFQFKLAGAAPKVEIVNESELADVYKKEKIEISIDKKKIGEDLKAGIPVQGAVLKENYSLRKSINKGSK